jgi:hypothetical protein
MPRATKTRNSKPEAREPELQPPEFDPAEDQPDEADDQDDYTDESPDNNPADDDPADQPWDDDPRAEFDVVPPVDPSRLTRQEQPKTARAGGDASIPPAYLAGLLRLNGVPAGLLDGLDAYSAWVAVQTRDMPRTAMPLAHLAPDALETLGDLGYEGHARFELTPSENSGPVRYFAAVLPGLPDDDGDDDDGRERDREGMILRAMNERLAMLEKALLAFTERAQVDPFEQVAKALRFRDSMIEQLEAPQRGGGDAEIVKALIEQFGPAIRAKLGFGDA